MDRQYRNKTQISVPYGFHEVDRFLQNSSNNTDFWPSTTSPYYEQQQQQRSPLAFSNGGSPYNIYTTSNPSYSTDNNYSNSINRDMPHPIRSILYHETKNNTSSSPNTNNYDGGGHHSRSPEYLTSIDAFSDQRPFSRAEKRRKSSAFKSLRSFLKKHLRLTENNSMMTPTIINKTQQKKLFKDNLTNESKHFTISNQNPNPNSAFNKRDFGDAVADSTTSNNSKMARAHSFSSSKLRPKELPIPHEERSLLIEPCSPPLPKLPKKPSTTTQQQEKIYNQQQKTYSKQISNNNSNNSQFVEVPPPINRTTKKNHLLSKIPCLYGIINHGNTCYMNAILQCLSSMDRFSEYFVCQNLLSTNSKNLITTQLALTIQSLWLNISADIPCLNLLHLIASANNNFHISIQQDAQESLIWLLDRIHEELKEDHLTRLSNSPSKLFKSEEELASDALQRVSGTNNSIIMEFFRAQFRSSMECMTCGFTNLTFDPYMTVSLSVPQTSQKTCYAIFIPYFNIRQIVRYKFNLDQTSILRIIHIKEKIMRNLSATAENTLACQIANNGFCHFLANDLKLLTEDKLNEFLVVEIPSISSHSEQHLIIVIVTHVLGVFPKSERCGNPYVLVLDRQWSYDRICKYIIEKGHFLFAKQYFPMYTDFKLLIQYSSDEILILDPTLTMPLYNDKIYPTTKNNVTKLIVEWDYRVGNDYLALKPEYIINDMTFVNGSTDIANNNSNSSGSSAITLINLLEDYIKTEMVSDWKCPKCQNNSGKKELMFHSMPPLLVFHLKRFEALNDGNTKKVESLVQFPLESLDLSSYIINSDSRPNTLNKKSSDKRKINGGFSKEDYPLYDLVGVVNHFGERTNSGHYTATTKNLIDSRWRTFDDTKVTFTEPQDICYSTNAYLLFYERRNSKQQFPASWYPNLIPKIVQQQLYNDNNNYNQQNASENGITVTGGSKFYVNDMNSRKTLSPITYHKNNNNNNNKSTSPSSIIIGEPARSKSYQTLSNNINNGIDYYYSTSNDYPFRGREYY